jgi:zinc protease
MSIRRALWLAFALAFSLLARPLHAGIARPLHQTRLANGLRVIVAPDPESTDVALLVRYDTGARDEPADLWGLAHLVEHVMFFGSRHVEPGGFARLLEQAGGSGLNGTTTLDATTYYERLPPERLELGLWLESDRMGYGLDRLDEATLARARAEVLNERREHVVQAALGAVPAVVYGELFPAWHPYHHLPIGTPEAVARVTTADVRAFFNTWYGPANALVVIAGKVDPAAATALVEKYFGSLPPRAPPVRPTVPFPAATGTTLVHVGAGVTRTEVRFAWVTPPFGAAGDAELDLTAAVLVDRGAGWLERVLLTSPRLCTQVSAFQDSMALASLFEIRTVLADGQPVKQALAGILAALGRFEADATDAEIERARMAFQNFRLFGLDSTLSIAGGIAGTSVLGPLGPVYDGRLGRYTAIAPRAVRDTVRARLGTRPWVVTIAHPTRGKSTMGEVTSREEVPW